MTPVGLLFKVNSEGLFTCPVNASPVDYAKIYPDPESEKAIMGSVVYCIHHKQGCQWSDELRKLKAHLNTCKHDAVLCAAQCGAMIPRVLMQDHLRYTCPRRRANCDHCHKEFSGSALEEHQGNCGHEPVYCENKCGAKVQRRHTQQHLQQHCSKRLVPCRHCGQRYTQDTVSAHGATCARAPVPCPQRCAAAPVPRDELDTHLRDHCAAAGVACAYKDAGCRFKGSRASVERHAEESCQAHLALVLGLAARQARQLEALRGAVARLACGGCVGSGGCGGCGGCGRSVGDGGRRSVGARVARLRRTRRTRAAPRSRAASVQCRWCARCDSAAWTVSCWVADWRTGSVAATEWRCRSRSGGCRVTAILGRGRSRELVARLYCESTRRTRCPGAGNRSRIDQARTRC